MMSSLKKTPVAIWYTFLNSRRRRQAWEGQSGRVPDNTQGCSPKVHSCNPHCLSRQRHLPANSKGGGKGEAGLWELSGPSPGSLEPRLKGKAICITSIISASLPCTSSMACGRVLGTQ